MESFKEDIKEVPHAALIAVEHISNYFKQEAICEYDFNGFIIFKWTFPYYDEPVQVHMFRTLNGGYAIGVADFGRDGKVAHKWSKRNNGHVKAAKRILNKTMNNIDE